MDTRLAFTAFNAEAEDLFYEEEEKLPEGRESEREGTNERARPLAWPFDR